MVQSAQIAGFIELNAQLVELHDRFSRDSIGSHLAQPAPGEICPTSPVRIDDHGFPNHIPCPCENEHIRNLPGKPGPTLIACPPALIPNMHSELNKFANLKVIHWQHSARDPGLNWQNLANCTPETLLALSRTVVLISSHQIARAIGSEWLSKMVEFDNEDPMHVSTQENLNLMHQLGFKTGQDDGEDPNSPVVWKTPKQARNKTPDEILVLHVQFARVFMDEGHKIRSETSQAIGWLKYIQSPVWIVSGSSGWMPPERWTGWVKLWQQQDWKTHPEMKRYTSYNFATIKNAFSNAAKDFNPDSGIPSPICEIDEEEYDLGRWPELKRRRILGDALRNWSKFLQRAMIRRTHQDRIWGSQLLKLPPGEIKVICVKFCDVDGEVQRNYQAVIEAAVQDACQQSQEKVRGNTGTNQNLAVNVYRRCRIASSIPALCTIVQFKDDNWDKASVAGFRNKSERASSPYRRFTETLVQRSPKLRWLRDFVRVHLWDSDEKLLIFSFSPIVLHCVDLVWPLLLVLYHSLIY